MKTGGRTGRSPRTCLDRKEARYTVELAASEGGRQTIPPVPFTYIAADGSLQRVESPPVTIEVEGGGDIKPMQADSTPPWTKAGLCFGAGLLVAWMAHHSQHGHEHRQ